MKMQSITDSIRKLCLKDGLMKIYVIIMVLSGSIYHQAIDNHPIQLAKSTAVKGMSFIWLGQLELDK